MEGILSLVNATEYAGFSVREWNIVQFSKLSGVLSAIAKEYDKRSVAFTDLSNALKSVDGLASGGANLPKSLLEIIEPIVTHSMVILTVSLGTTPDKLEKITFTDGLILLLLILKVNLEHLSSFFGKLVAPSAAQEVAATATM